MSSDLAPFSSMSDFIQEVIVGFAQGAPRHHHLVFKAHPLEDGRVPMRHTVKETARKNNIGERVLFVGGGKLAPLLNDAKSAVTVNSTAGQQVLWRGLPLKVFGDSVYGKPEFVSGQPLAKFFSDPTPPHSTLYKAYRRYLLQTSQIPGGFYSASGRKRLLRRLVDMMLSAQDPYEVFHPDTAAPQQQFKIVT